MEAPLLVGQIVYADGGDVYRLDLRHGMPVRLTDDPADEFDPDLSPDGSQVAYRMASGRGDQADIWLMNVDGSDKRNLTRDASLSNWAPAWSPDGKWLCFNSTRDGVANRIWLMDPDGGNLQLVTEGWGEYCDWSPDGQRIVYAAAPDGGSYDLWISALDGSAPIRLTDLPGTEFFPAWSPDGRFIAFEHLDEGIWLYSPDASERRFIGEGGAVVWSPDGLLGFDRPGGFALYDSRAGTVARTSLILGRFPSWGR
jgi:Tol biopolymer transport system component